MAQVSGYEEAYLVEDEGHKWQERQLCATRAIVTIVLGKGQERKNGRRY